MLDLDLQVYIDDTLLAGGDQFAIGAPGGLVVDLQADGSHVVEIAQLIRATSPSMFDRVTKTKNLKFSVNIQHESLTAAFIHSITHDESLPGVGDLKFIFSEGLITTTITYVGAAWTATTMQQIGFSTLTQYTVTAGRATVTSGPAGPITDDSSVQITDDSDTPISTL